MTSPVIDVFLSYASVDAAHADRLAAALERAGVSVWRDTQRIETFDAIQPVIAEGLSRSKALLALYSINYTKRRACDWELAAAYVAGGAERVLVVNPEVGTDHIQPQTLREPRLAVLKDYADLDALAQGIKAAVAKFDAPLGALPKPADGQAWIGLPRHGGSHRFVGRRTEIWQVHDGLAAGSVLLTPTTSGPVPGDGTAMLRGLGGVGKSLLAEEYARRFAAAWPGGIFWLRASGGESKDASGQLFGQRQILADKLGIPQQPDADALERALARAMATRPGPYLWVVDDLPYGLSSRQVRQWLAPSGQGRTLITTRDRGVDGIARVVDLAELMQEEALRLLTLSRLPSSPDEDAAAAEIVELIGRHALAVDLARHLVERRGYAKLLIDLRDPGKEALELAAQMRLELPNDHDKSISETLLQSIRLLGQASLDVLRLASVLAPHEPIPEELFAVVSACADSKTVVEADQNAAFLAIDQVHSHSLCEAKDGYYTVHALVCRTVALRIADARSAAIRVSAVEMLRRAMSVVHDIRRYAEIAVLVPHGHVLAAQPNTLAEAEVIGLVGKYFYEAGVYGASATAYSAQRVAYEKLLGAAHTATLSSMNNLATTLSKRGDQTEAQHLLEQVVDASGRTLGVEHPDTLAAMHNLANTLREQGDLVGALRLQEQVVDASRRILGPENHATLSGLNNLAGLLYAYGDYGGARRLHEGVLSTHRRILGESHPTTWSSMNNLAFTLLALGEYAGARRMQEGVLAARCRVLGAEHPDTLTAKNDLAHTLFAMGEFIAARQIEEDVFDVRRRVLGVEHPDTLTSASNLASTLYEQNDLVRARQLQEHALSVRRRILGDNHPDTITSINNLAATLWAQGEGDGALLLQGEAVDARFRILGRAHPDSLQSAFMLGGMLMQVGQTESGGRLMKLTVTKMSDILGSNHPSVLEAKQFMDHFTSL